ncbi:hypothetical protein N0V83_008745 [Neocucurbitaria cava]|uniref:Response regulatory domain-containing protein n=1 Tax=Neocucurbitaria cava TaxID=798079 RepID=A0A9W8Y437_9PLEO|nr:hypothetical protein N0V83_008745 [Neocucurbitaria cava]
MQKRNLRYEIATNGLEALKAYQECAPKFNAILMDMSMPVMDGMSATRAIRQYEQTNNLPRCSIVALTGLASESAKLEAWNSGIDHFMTKPINFKALEQVLKGEEERRARNAANAAGKLQEVNVPNVEGGKLEANVLKIEEAKADRTVEAQAGNIKDDNIP